VIRINQRNAREIPAGKSYEEVDPLVEKKSKEMDTSVLRDNALKTQPVSVERQFPMPTILS
jgi:hypothetical protein